MKRAGQSMTSSQIMTVNHITHFVFFVFCFSKRQDTIKCFAFFFQKFCYFVRCFDRLWVAELIIKSAEELSLVSDEELFIGTMNGTENVGFA